MAEEARRHLRLPGTLGASLPRLLLTVFVVPTLSFFTRWWTAILFPLLLLLALYAATVHRTGSAPRRRPPTASALAMLWFMAAYVVLVLLFWAPEYRYAAAVGLLGGTGLMFGGEVGETLWGRTPYRTLGREGRVEGEVFAGVLGFATLLLSLVYLSELPTGEGVLLAVLLTLVGLLIRLVTPGQAAHFTVPAALSVALFFLSRSGGANPLLARLLWGVGLSGIIALLGLRWRALSPDGAAAAVGIGTFVLAFGGWGWAVPLVVFFVASSALSHWKAGVKEGVKAVKGKEGPRDLGQVLANGLVAALVAALTLFFPNRAGWLFLAFLGAVAEAAADTWATEVGVLSSRRPRLIAGGGECPPGTSGGVTALGLAASAAGAFLIAATGVLMVWPWGRFTLWRLLIPWAAGFAGALVDSLLGATVQAGYYCSACATGAEHPLHGCGAPTVLRRGYAWLDNDLVNLAGTLAGALLAAGLGLLLPI